MKLSDRLYQILRGSRDVEERDGALHVPQDVEVEVYLNAGAELAPIAKVTEVRLIDGLWAIRNAKSEVLYFEADRVVGLRVNDSGKRRGEIDRSAGFTRGL